MEHLKTREHVENYLRLHWYADQQNAQEDEQITFLEYLNDEAIWLLRDSSWRWNSLTNTFIRVHYLQY